MSRLALKLFAVLLAVALGSVALTAWRIAGKFDVEFTEYLKRIDRSRLESLAGAVANEFRAHSNIDHLRRDGWRDFHDRIDSTLGGLIGPPGRPGANGRQPSGEQRDPARPPRDDDQPPRPNAAVEPPQRQSAIQPPMRDATAFYRRATLFSADGERLAGPFPVPGLVPIERAVVVNGRKVASISVTPLPRPADATDVQFVKSLRSDIFASALSAVVGALAAALLFAWWFGRRVASVSHVANRIASGDLAARAPESGKDELAQLGADLNRMATALESQEGIRRRWLANVAHELRTPLTVLRGEVEALLDGVRSATPQALQSLSEEIAHLSRITDDLHLLALDDLDSLPVSFALVDVSALVMRAAERWTPAATQAGLRIRAEVATPAWVRSDAGRLQQVIDNLVANSVRYTDTPGEITLAVVSSQTTVEIVVEDSAPGVPTAVLVQLFEPLFKSDPARSRSNGGSGLGLAVARAVVRALQGDIVASASDLGGLRVTVSLPGDATEATTMAATKGMALE